MSGEVPSGWTPGRLGSHMTVKARLGWKGLMAEEYQDKGYIFLATPNIKGLDIDFSDVNYVSERRYLESPEIMLQVGDVLLVKDGSTLGTSNIIRWLPAPATMNGSIALLRCRPTFDSSFLHQLTKGTGFQKLIFDKKAGLGVPHLFQADLREFPLDVPPLREQRRIAEILDTLDEAIRKTERVVAKLQQMKQGLLHDLLTRGIDEHGELRDPIRHPEQFKDSPLGKIPKEWAVRSVKDTGDVKLGRQRAPQYDQGAYMRPYLRVANVFDGYIRFDNVLRMNFSPPEQQAYSLVPGDILLNEGQSLELVGRCAIFDGAPNVYCFQNTLVRFRAHPLVITPTFAQAVFRDWLVRGTFMQIAKQTTSIAHLGAERFAGLRLACPGIAEQCRINAEVQAFERHVEKEVESQSKLRLLKQGLMDDLLTGRVRVKATEAAE